MSLCIESATGSCTVVGIPPDPEHAVKEITQLAAELGRRLQLLNAHVTTAESCTGGGIAEAITRIPGSSAWFEAGYVTYSNRQKTQQLNVPAELFGTVGAVSREVVEAMVRGAQETQPGAVCRGGQRDGRPGRRLAEQTGGHRMAGLWCRRCGEQRSSALPRQPRRGPPTNGEGRARGAPATSGTRNRKSGVGDPRTLWNNTGYLYRCWPSGLIDYVRTLMDDNKKKALAAALGQIERQFGKGAVMRMGDQDRQAIPAISTGSLGLDIALGIGGLPKGRIVEIYGPESSGKTTLTLSVIAQAQKAGATCAFVDAEHALDPEYAGKLGVNVDDLLVSQPDTGEQALEITDMLVRSNAVDVIIVDSVAALVPKAEIEGEMGDMHVGLQARLMSQALRKITGNIKNANCLVIFINQIRMKIGVMFGSPETTTGGNALKFYASVRLDIRRTGAVKEGDEVVGSETRVKVVKNKVASPFRQAEFQILYGKGIYLNGEMIDLGVLHGFVEKSGAWYAYEGTKIGQGKANSAKFLADNPEIAAKLEKQLRDKLLTPAVIDSKASAVKETEDDLADADI